jgi:orotate phosphoribosyltransferase
MSTLNKKKLKIGFLCDFICQSGLSFKNFIHLQYDFNKDTAEKTAEFLLQINAIKLNLKNPFMGIGCNSIYCDNRIILSPTIRNYLRVEFAKQVEAIYGKPDVIAGVATGALDRILVAEELGILLYVRPEPKKTWKTKSKLKVFAKRTKCSSD